MHFPDGKSLCAHRLHTNPVRQCWRVSRAHITWRLMFVHNPRVHSYMRACVHPTHPHLYTVGGSLPPWGPPHLFPRPSLSNTHPQVMAAGTPLARNGSGVWWGLAIIHCDFCLVSKHLQISMAGLTEHFSGLKHISHSYKCHLTWVSCQGVTSLGPKSWPAMSL